MNVKDAIKERRIVIKLLAEYLECTPVSVHRNIKMYDNGLYVTDKFKEIFDTIQSGRDLPEGLVALHTDAMKDKTFHKRSEKSGCLSHICRRCGLIMKTRYMEHRTQIDDVEVYLCDNCVNDLYEWLSIRQEEEE